MAGLPDRLPASLHAWDPVVLAAPGAARILTLTRAATAGRAHRTGAGSAHVLGTLLRAGGGARHAGPATAAARPLRLTIAPGDGQVHALIVGTGTAHQIVGLSTNGHGVKQARGHAVSTARLLTVKAASGQSARQVHGLAYKLAYPFARAHGGKHTSGPARRPHALPLRIRASKNWMRGSHREFFLTSPTDRTHELLAPNQSRRFVATVTVGLTVWRSLDGTWHAQYAPEPALLAAADRVYAGGRRHRLTDAARFELEAAGFGPHITLLEVRP